MDQDDNNYSTQPQYTNQQQQPNNTTTVHYIQQQQQQPSSFQPNHMQQQQQQQHMFVSPSTTVGMRGGGGGATNGSNQVIYQQQSDQRTMPVPRFALIQQQQQSPQQHIDQQMIMSSTGGTMRPMGPRIVMTGNRQPTPRFTSTVVGQHSPIANTASQQQQQQPGTLHFANVPQQQQQAQVVMMQQPSQAIRQALNHPISSSTGAGAAASPSIRSIPTNITASSSTSHTPVPSTSLSSDPLMDRKRLDDLVKEVDPHEMLEEDVKDALLQLTDEFVDKVLNDSCRLAKHRGSEKLEPKDVQLVLERNWNMWMPGMGTDELRPYKKATITDAHKQRMAIIKKTLKKP